MLARIFRGRRPELPLEADLELEQPNAVFYLAFTQNVLLVL